MHLKSITAFAVVLLLFVSCNHSADDKSSSQDYTILNRQVKEILTTDSLPTTPQFIPESSPNKDPKKGNEPGDSKTSNTDWDKKIIKTANLRMEVKDFKACQLRMREITKKYGGYIASEQQRQDEFNINNSISVKVPVAQFEDAVNEITDNALTIDEKNISTDDVTTQMIDTRSRLETKRQTLGKYYEFMKEAKNMQDVLSVQSSINGLQEEIEAAGGRVNYLGHNAAYSTINLTYYQVLKENNVKEGEDGFSSRAGDSFGRGWAFIKELLLGLLSIWPLLIGIAGLVFWLKVKRSGNKAIKAKASLDSGEPTAE